MNIPEIHPLNKMSQGELSLLMFECMTALSSSEAKWRELKQQGKLTKLFRGLNGKNNQLRFAMQENLIVAQQAAVKLIEQLAKQQALSFTMLSTLHEKMNQLQLENNQRFAQLLDTIDLVYNDSAEKFHEIFTRLDTQQKQLDCVEWRQNLPHMAYEGVPYVKLTGEKKMVCAVADFYQMTKGDWQQTDERYIAYFLKDLQLQKPVDVQAFYAVLSRDQALWQRLFSVLTLEKDMPTALYSHSPLLAMLTQQPAPQLVKVMSPLALAMDVLAQLAMIEEACRLPKGYEVVLKTIPHIDRRLTINRTLHKEASLPIEQCRMITNGVPIENRVDPVEKVPIAVTQYTSIQQAQTLKKALEIHKCSVEIIEAY